MDMKYDFPNLNSLVNFEKSSPDQNPPSKGPDRTFSFVSEMIFGGEVYKTKRKWWRIMMESPWMFDPSFRVFSSNQLRFKKGCTDIFSNNIVSSSCIGWWIGKSYSHLCYTYTPQSQPPKSHQQWIHPRASCCRGMSSPFETGWKPPLWDCLQPRNSAKALG